MTFITSYSSRRSLRRNPQRGVVLFIALIVLVVMTISGVALIRSMDTATLGTSNLILNQSAEQSAERAVAAAMLKFDPNAIPAGFFTVPSNAEAHQAAHNYCATMLPTDANGIPLVLVSIGTNKDCDNSPLDTTNQITTSNNETLRFVIDRLCTQVGSPDQSFCAIDTTLPTGGTVGSGNPLGITSPLYRVTVRADGPRNTVSFTQVVFKR